jgi:hypothetical protein
VRGLKVNKDSRKLDVVLVAARYNDEGALKFAKGYERRGKVWSDIRIFDRETLLNKVRSGAKVVTGNPVAIPGNYDPAGIVRIIDRDGGERLVTDGKQNQFDDLGLPVL